MAQSNRKFYRDNGAAAYDVYAWNDQAARQYEDGRAYERSRQYELPEEQVREQPYRRVKSRTAIAPFTLVGMLTGIAIGFSKTFSYWIQPLVRVLGPIPSTAWIPIVLIAFPSAVSASAFLIALAVWFPTTVLTSSGIASIPNSYFEVSSTLGAGSLYRIVKVGIPAAMPHMFLGLFNGTCSSFITLVTAEMLGAKYGIGWYINWQKEMMAYANVYAGLIIIAVTFFILITLLFKFRDHVLAWQKGVIKW